MPLTTADQDKTSVALRRDRKILVIDDESGLRELLHSELSAEGYSVETANDGEEGLKLLESRKVDLVFCDINMPKLNGVDFLKELRKQNIETEVIIMTGYGTVETAVTAMKYGAYDFIEKPFNLNLVLALAEKSLEKSDLKSIVTQLREAKQKLEETQAQLIQSEKLAGIGLLAAGVAHELNNPLSGVLGFAQLLLADETLSAQQRKDVETICAQTQRCRTIIQNLLHFSRRKSSQKEPLDVLQLVEETRRLVDYEFFTSAVEIVQNVPASLAKVLGDSDQLQQVLLNLLTNARQAMESQPSGRVVIDVQQNPSHVIIRVSDTGPGVPAELQSKIFDPFFTTKPPGKGTGLGLSLCYGIVQAHQGTLRVESLPGAGATFILEFPRYDG